MTNTSDHNKNLALLETTLETYGADRTRWPAEIRRELTGIIGVSVEAQRQMTEAAALDRLLDMAPALPDARRQALANRIVGVAKTTPRVASSSAPTRKPVTASYLENGRRENWAAGMALAASLVLGLYAGSHQSVMPALQEIASAAGFGSDAGLGQADIGDDSEIYSNEDVL